MITDLDEEITSDEDDQYIKGKHIPEEDRESEDEETAQEKKVRLAHEYLKELQERSEYCIYVHHFTSW